MENKVFKLLEAKTILSSKFGYNQKDMQSNAIIIAMFAQEGINATVVDGTESDFELEETYVIKDFTKPITVVGTADTTSVYTIGKVNVSALMQNYQKDKFNLDLWCFLANQTTGATFSLDDVNASLFPNHTEEKVVMLFDELVILGYLKETATALVFNIDKQPTSYKLKKHNGLRFAGYIKTEEEDE